MHTAISCGQWQPWMAVSPIWGSPARQSHWVNELAKPVSETPFAAKASAKHSIKHQLHTTIVVAVGWQQHISSPTT